MAVSFGLMTIIIIKRTAAEGEVISVTVNMYYYIQRELDSAMMADLFTTSSPSDSEKKTFSVLYLDSH